MAYESLTDEQLQIEIDQERVSLKECEFRMKAKREEACRRQKEPWVALNMTRKQWLAKRTLEGAGFSINDPRGTE